MNFLLSPKHYEAHREFYGEAIKCFQLIQNTFSVNHSSLSRLALAAEVWLSGCGIIAYDCIGTFSYDFYPNDNQRAIREIMETLGRFWDTISNLISNDIQIETPKLGNVVVKNLMVDSVTFSL